jgi:hypothetical protein
LTLLWKKKSLPQIGDLGADAGAAKFDATMSERDRKRMQELENEKNVWKSQVQKEIQTTKRLQTEMGFMRTDMEKWKERWGDSCERIWRSGRNGEGDSSVKRGGIHEDGSREVEGTVRTIVKRGGVCENGYGEVEGTVRKVAERKFVDKRK